MGYPVSIKDDKYERNALLFNMCFVFEKEAETESYEQIVRKMARVLRSLEVRDGKGNDGVVEMQNREGQWLICSLSNTIALVQNSPVAVG